MGNVVRGGRLLAVALEFLQRRLHPGDVLYFVPRHRLPGGSQVFSVYTRGYAPHDDMANIDWAVASVAGFTRSTIHNGFIVRDGDSVPSQMQQVLSALGAALYPGGYPCRGGRWCSSNAHHEGDEGPLLQHHDDTENALRARLL